jgi:hypothetical protein
MAAGRGHQASLALTADLVDDAPQIREVWNLRLGALYRVLDS